jgi:hypothetical protein
MALLQFEIGDTNRQLPSSVFPRNLVKKWRNIENTVTVVNQSAAIVSPSFSTDGD